MFFKSNITKIIVINLFITFLGLEILSRIHYSIKLNNKDKLALLNYPELRNYLKFVNHYRDEDYPKQDQERNIESNNKYSAINKKNPSYYIYSQYSKCKDKGNSSENLFGNCKAIFLQGDSVGEGLGSSATDILFSYYIKKGWQTFNMSTTSFSPKNSSAQLAYFHKRGLKPEIIIKYIDQGDLGDDYFRYRKNSKYIKNQIRHYKVKPFLNSHLRFYNYGSYLYPSNIYGFTPISINLIKGIYRKLLVSVFYLTNGKINLTETPGWSKIIEPLINKDEKANIYFKNVLNNYVNTAKDLGVKELYFISMPHPRNFVESVKKERRFNYSVAEVIDDYVYSFNEQNQIKVYHIPTEVNQNIFPCKDETCSGFYLVNDHHPDAKGYKYMAQNITQFIRKRSSF